MGMVRSLREAIGLSPFSRAELEVLADVLEGRLWSMNYVAEHPAHVYAALQRDRLIYLDQFKGVHGTGVEARLDFDDGTALRAPIGVWRLSPAISETVVQAIKSFIASQTVGGRPRRTARQRGSEAIVEQRRRRAISSDLRLMVLWHLSFGLKRKLSDERSARALVVPPTLETVPDPSARWPTIRPADEDLHAVLDELLAPVDETVLKQTAQSCGLTWPGAPSDKLELLTSTVSTKADIAERLELADSWRRDPGAAREWRRKDRAESRRRIADLLLHADDRVLVAAALRQPNARRDLACPNGCTLFHPASGSPAGQRPSGPRSKWVDRFTIDLVLMEQLDAFPLETVKTTAKALGMGVRISEPWHVWDLQTDQKLELALELLRESQ